ncbi:unnamed protein product [Vitrella brassicaformis CCMP3155]|uniref:Uncharacterized protein n=1 Tax=Vitrella brassicaformis (strain CCMP3155) TaxID=1169540 RepID=A0A0G4H1U6_VITBC|nr:unnamed protein product [Vitrella brassicaformis CCMP3155]|eukprot:CEM37595.1 unnamed protein product [Vitrella brassicaformis CCMP3155]
MPSAASFEDKAADAHLAPPCPANAEEGSIPAESVADTAVARQVARLTIFDWDDTLFATTAIMTGPLSHGGEESEIRKALKGFFKKAGQQMAALDAAASKAMEKAVAEGKVIVITNGETAWVRLSSGFMPLLQKVMEDNTVQVVSSREAFSKNYPDRSDLWKIYTFAREIGKVRPLDMAITIGDAPHDMDALKKYRGKGSGAMAKRFVRFTGLPEPPTLTKELDTLSSLYDEIIHPATKRKNWDMDDILELSLPEDFEYLPMDGIINPPSPPPPPANGTPPGTPVASTHTPKRGRSPSPRLRRHNNNNNNNKNRMRPASPPPRKNGGGKRKVGDKASSASSADEDDEGPCPMDLSEDIEGVDEVAKGRSKKAKSKGKGTGSGMVKTREVEADEVVVAGDEEEGEGEGGRERDATPQRQLKKLRRLTQQRAGVMRMSMGGGDGADDGPKTPQFGAATPSAGARASCRTPSPSKRGKTRLSDPPATPRYDFRHKRSS